MDKKAQGLSQFMKDFDIKFSAKEGKSEEDLRLQLGKIFCEEVAECEKGNERAYALADACEYNYRGMSIYKQRGQRKNKPWIGACDFWTPLTEWIVCAIAARVDSILFAVEPMMTASANEMENVEQSPEITDFMDVVMNEIVKLRESFKFYLKQKIKQPLAVASLEWVYQEEKVREIEQGVVQESEDGTLSVKLASGQVVEATELPKDVQDEIISGELKSGEMAYWYVERDKGVMNQPEFLYHSPRDYCWTPATKKKQKPFLEGYKFWQTIGEIRKKQKSEEYFDDDIISAKLEATIAKQVGEGDIAKRVLVERAHPYECRKIFTRLPFNDKGEIDLEDKEAVEMEVIAEVAFVEKVLLKLHKWHYLRYPHKERVFLHGWYEEKDTILDDASPFIGRSMTEKISEINELINKEFQQIVDNADLAMTKVFTKVRSLTNEDWEEPEIYPGALWDVERQGDIMALDVGTVEKIGLEIMNRLLDFAVRLSNISSLNVAARMEGGKPLATEVVNILKESEIGRENFLQTCHEDLRTIYKWTADYYFQFMPEGLERRIRGQDAQLMFPEPPKEKQFKAEGGAVNQEDYKKALEDFEKKKYYTREMLIGVGKWDFKWNGTQLSSDREWQIAVADYLVETLPKFPGIVTMTGIWESLRDALISRGKKDWQKYLGPRQKFEQLDQMDLAKSQLQARLPQIRQQMLDGGMDPALVAKTIAKIDERLRGGGEENAGPAGEKKPARRGA